MFPGLMNKCFACSDCKLGQFILFIQVSLSDLVS